MAATVYVNRYYGAGPSTRDAASGNIRFSTSDNDYTTETTNPIPIPAAGTNYSYWVCTALYANTSPSGTINNAKWYMDGTNGWTSVTMEVGTSDTYTQATGTAGTTGDELTDTNYTGGTLTPSDPSADSAFGYTSGSPLSVTGSISNPDTGIITDYVIIQLSIGTGASAGTLSTESVTWSYDET